MKRPVPSFFIISPHCLWGSSECKNYQQYHCRCKNHHTDSLDHLAAFCRRLTLAFLLDACGTLLSCLYSHHFFSLMSTTILSSSSWPGSSNDGASIMVSRPELFLGNAIQSRIESRPAKRLTQRSRPYARPP